MTIEELRENNINKSICVGWTRIVLCLCCLFLFVGSFSISILPTFFIQPNIIFMFFVAAHVLAFALLSVFCVSAFLIITPLTLIYAHLLHYLTAIACAGPGLCDFGSQSSGICIVGRNCLEGLVLEDLGGKENRRLPKIFPVNFESSPRT